MSDRILVVDDSGPNRLVATGHLESAGYEVVALASGEEALAWLAREKADLVVLDVLMPGIGGFETCRRLRATPAIADVPVLFLTALGDRDTTMPALEAGGDDMLPKPFHRGELLLRVRALIRQRRITLELKRAEDDRRKLAQLVVHDLKGPLAAIAGNAEILRELALDEEVDEIASDILVAADQIDRTARDLLDLSRAEDGAFAARPETFDLKALAAEVAASMRGVARWTNIAIELDVQVASAVADRELTRRLLQNLLHNAMKFAPAGTVVRVEASRDGAALVVRVLDEGPGVAPGDTEKIFERGVSLDHQRRHGGHGLGLAFCRLATEAHGGKIWVEGREPHGASFCVRIPQP